MLDDGTAHVLVIEDDPEMCRVLKFLLRSENYEVLEARTGQSGLDLASKRSPDIILLDLGLPDMDGTNIVADLGRSGQRALIVLSARDQEHQKILALDRGATDYVTKPFGAGELLARIRAGLRRARSKPEEETSFRFGELEVDLLRETVLLAGRALPMTPTEYKLMRALARARGTVLTHRQLLEAAWGPDSVKELHYLRVYVARLRSKLESDPARPRYVITEPNIGYRMGHDCD